MKKIRIYQINENVENARYFMFSGLEMLEHLGLRDKLSIDLYDMVWEGEVEDNATLDDIYREFNLNHPKDFNGHSLSVSDIVLMDGKYFYCDDYGWEEVDFKTKGFKKGDYITKKTKAPYPSLQTLRIEAVIGKMAETTTGIAGGCTVENLDNYRLATEEEKKAFIDMEKRAYAW